MPGFLSSLTQHIFFLSQSANMLSPCPLSQFQHTGQASSVLTQAAPTKPRIDVSSRMKQSEPPQRWRGQAALEHRGRSARCRFNASLCQILLLEDLFPCLNTLQSELMMRESQRSHRGCFRLAWAGGSTALGFHSPQCRLSVHDFGLQPLSNFEAIAGSLSWQHLAPLLVGLNAPQIRA